MTKTPPITLSWIQDSANRFSNLPITQAALDLINKSEILKADIRAYATSNHTRNADLHPTQGAASYTVPHNGEKGVMLIASNRLSTAEGTFNILS